MSIHAQGEVTFGSLGAVIPRGRVGPGVSRFVSVRAVNPGAEWYLHEHPCSGRVYFRFTQSSKSQGPKGAYFEHSYSGIDYLRSTLRNKSQEPRGAYMSIHAQGEVTFGSLGAVSPRGRGFLFELS
jgi:hypothetical protein